MKRYVEGEDRSQSTLFSLDDYIAEDNPVRAIDVFVDELDLAKLSFDWTGIQGIPAQDMAMWESMGPITDRSDEIAGSSDLAVVHFRRMMVAAAEKFRDGGSAIGATEPRVSHVKLASFEGVVPKTTDWRTLGTQEETPVAAG
jgi:phthalate 4,5-dioxygenase oxygenase subunit